MDSHGFWEDILDPKAIRGRRVGHWMSLDVIGCHLVTFGNFGYYY